MKINFCQNWIYQQQGAESKLIVDLPHDAMIEGQRSKDASSGGAGAYFEGGVYCYQKEFEAPQEWKEKCVYLEFEGVYRKAKVLLNGELAAEHAYGYTGFLVNCDGLLHYGEKNVIEVIADNSEQPNSRWYAGGGIYRPV